MYIEVALGVILRGLQIKVLQAVVCGAGYRQTSNMDMVGSSVCVHIPDKSKYYESDKVNLMVVLFITLQFTG